ncbi:hypothetical protein BCU68_11690 [Vibrio sp. 10N.286.49.B3]|uniref:YjiH family protein n=1 Tax=Vibrio sp. 10N.286.49.B3 TaxID=1880855 RepID=UPI000C826937|nr:nucleoside recognition domain-containing protein [Vibrio sp. 10N.286.49.B3]PMH44805.1 hypothetical protein BCU68_11690 [Vibrio sp. 10N.286.49.B3]
MTREKLLDPQNIPDPVHQNQYTSLLSTRFLTFFIPSLFGALIFLTPIKNDIGYTLLLATLIEVINGLLSPIVMEFIVLISVLPTLLYPLSLLSKQVRNNDHPIAKILFPEFRWVLVRALGGLIILMVYFDFGPEWISHTNTGGLLLNDVAPVMFGCYLISALLLPLLTHFGLADFTGVMISKLFNKAFNLPGRAAIDALTSWVSASSVGVIMTATQYRNGGYSKREAAIVATNFSIVSITFAYVILKFVHLEAHFITWYACVLACGVVCAMIVSRLPPLRMIDNTLINGELKDPADNGIDYQGSLLHTATEHGMTRAEKAGSLKTMLTDAIYFVIDTTITVIPAMMLFGGLGLSLIEFTNILDVVSVPLVPYLKLLGIPEASAAAAAICSGFIDILMPVIVGSSIESEITRFVIAGVAVNQLVFMNEIAVLMLKAKIGLSITKIAVLWLLRVLISIPFMAFCAHMLF